MRALTLILAFVLALAPAVQVFAGTLSSAHCRLHGHVSVAAPDTASHELHAAHHGGDFSMPASLNAAGHDHGGTHGQCDCPCGLAGMTGTLPAPVFSVSTAVSAHDSWRMMSVTDHPIAVHFLLLRPPVVS